jgi:hypothetical protein
MTPADNLKKIIYPLISTKSNRLPGIHHLNGHLYASHDDLVVFDIKADYDKNLEDTAPDKRGVPTGIRQPEWEYALNRHAEQCAHCIPDTRVQQLRNALKEIPRGVTWLYTGYSPDDDDTDLLLNVKYLRTAFRLFDALKETPRLKLDTAGRRIQTALLASESARVLFAFARRLEDNAAAYSFDILY